MVRACLVLVVALGILVAGPVEPTHAGAGRDWVRVEREGIGVDAPRGWAVEIRRDGQSRVIAVEGRDSNGDPVKVFIARGPAQRGTSEEALAKAMVQKVMGSKAEFFSDSGKGYAIVSGRRMHVKRVALARVHRDSPGPGSVTIGVVRASRRAFDDHPDAAYLLLDRMLVSLEHPTTTPMAGAPAYSARQIHRSTAWGLKVPKGWIVTEEGGFVQLAPQEGEDIPYGVLLTRVGQKLDAGKTVCPRLVASLGKDPRRLGAREFAESARVQLWAVDQPGKEIRVLCRAVDTYHGQIVAIAAGERRYFWSMALPRLTESLIDSRGVGGQGLEPLVGTWAQTTADEFLEKLASDAVWPRGFQFRSFRISFDGKGGYRLEYGYIQSFHLDRRREVRYLSLETGRYGFDGFELQLVPKRREVTEFEKNKREVYQKKLRPSTFRIRDLGQDGAIRIDGYGIEAVGMPPTWARSNGFTYLYRSAAPKGRGKPVRGAGAGFGRRK